MSYLDAVLIAEARRLGRAQRKAVYRHLHLVPKPLGMLTWQLGAEPFTAAAVAWGFGPDFPDVAVPGEPRDRELAFRALTRVATSFNRWFEKDARGQAQVVVPNQANLRLLGRLGRRLAYLPTEGERPADPELVRFGRHLSFLALQSNRPGQQLVVVLTELLAAHWVGELSALEGQNLPAMDAAIDPPSGKSAYEAICGAERLEVGPLPSEADDSALGPLLQQFNERRARSTDPGLVKSLVGEIEAHYRTLVMRGWPLMWRVLERERAIEEARHAAKRWSEDDTAELERHLAWVVDAGGGYRTRQTHKQAAHWLHSWEEAERHRIAEEAIDDPLRMLPYILRGEAVRGKVVAVDATHTEKPNTRSIVMPIVTLETSLPCTIPIGTELHWAVVPSGRSYAVVSIVEHGQGSRVTLKRTAGQRSPDVPKKGTIATFSMLDGGGNHFLMLPKEAPWTHRRAIEESGSIEESDAEGAGA